MKSQKEQALEIVKRQLEKELRIRTKKLFKQKPSNKQKEAIKTSKKHKKQLNENKSSFIKPYEIFTDVTDDGNTFIVRFTKVVRNDIERIDQVIHICNTQIRNIINNRSLRKDIKLSGTKYITFRPYKDQIEIIYNIKCRGLDQAIFFLTELTSKSTTSNVRIINNKVTAYTIRSQFNLKAITNSNAARKILIYNTIEKQSINDFDSIIIDDVQLFTSTKTDYDNYDFNPLYAHRFFNQKPKCKTITNFGIFHNNTKQ